MLTCISRSRTYVSNLGPILIPASGKHIFIPHYFQLNCIQIQCGSRYSSITALTALEEPNSVGSTSPAVLLLQELSQLAEDVEKSLDGKLFLQFPELYASFRLLALDCSRTTRIPTNLLVTLFPSLNQFYDTARTRLCRNPSKQNAALHVMMYKDASIIFRGNLSLKHPLYFASESFELLIDRNIMLTAQNVFEHIKHLAGMLPSDLSAFLSPERMENWMAILASSSDTNAITLLQRMVLGLPQCLGIQPSRKHHHYVLKTLLKTNQAGRAWRWLERMQFQNHLLNERKKRYWWTKLSHLPWFSSDDYISCSPSITWITTRTQDYDLFLTYFAKCRDFISAKLLIRQMFILGPPVLPGQRSWHLYLLAAISHTRSTVSAVVKEMSDAGFGVNLTVLASLSGREELGSWISEDLYSLLRLKEAQKKPKIFEEAMLDLLPDFNPDTLYTEITAQVKVPTHLERLFSSHNSVASVQMPSEQGSTLETLPKGEEFGISPDPFRIAFEIPVPERTCSQDLKAVTSGGSREPEATAKDYCTSTDRGVDADKLRRTLIKMSYTPNMINTLRGYNAYISLSGSKRFDVELGSALIRGLCRNTLKAASKRNVWQAVKIYKDLLASDLNFISPSFFTPSSDDKLKIDTTEELKEVYYTLLRNLTAPLTAGSSCAEALQNQERCVGYMHYLLNEMKIRKIAPDSRLVAPIVLLQWRSTGSHEEALQFYMSFISDLESSPSRSDIVVDSQSLLDLGSFRSILNSFGQLSFQDEPITPARLWHVFLSHIRARGYVSTSKDYALYLNNIISKDISPLALRYTSLGMGPPEEEESIMKSMHDSLKHLLRQITIDIHIAPDAVLFNTLINAFQRVGAFNDALRIFNLSWLTGQVDAVTPVILFDACGYAKRPVEAYIIWNMLARRRWKFDKRALDTWVECLCRLGYVTQACKFVCLYMGKVHGEYDTVGDTKPDVNTCLILLQLSWKFGQNSEVKDKIKSHLPHIWKELSAKYM